MPIHNLTQALKATLCFFSFTLISNLTLANTPGGCNPGISTGDIAICGEPVCLFDYLGGNPDLGGTWVGPQNSGWEDLTGCGYFDPATHPIGDYSYLIYDFDVICSATVTIVESAPLSEVNNAETVLCTALGEVDLYTLLAGTPTVGGTWTNPEGENIGNTINSESALSGIYTYTIEEGPCAGTANLTLSFEWPSNAGADTWHDYCGDGSILHLVTLSDPTSNPGGIFGPNTFIELYPENSGVYTYTTLSGPACPPDVAMYTINIQPELQATATAYCEPGANEYYVDLTINGGTPPYQIIGGLGVFIPGNTYTAGPILLGNTYNFTITDNGPCPDTSVIGTSPECECTTSLSTITSTNSEICTGTCTELNFELIGTPPFEINWSANGIPQDPFLITDVSTIQICPEETTIYDFISVSDANCTSSLENQSVTIEVGTNDLGIVANHVQCSGSINLNEILESYTEIEGNNGDWTDPDGNPVLLDLVDPNTSNPGIYTYSFNEIDGCYTIAQIFIQFSTSYSTGTETFAEVCDDLPLVCPFNLLEGDPTPAGLWNHYDSNGAIINFYGNYDVCIPMEEIDDGDYITYYLSVPTCEPSSTDLHINLIDGPECECDATAAFTSTDQFICEDNCANIGIVLEGTPPFTLTYTDGVDNFQFVASSASTSITVCPETNTTYSLIEIEDVNCVGSINTEEVTVYVTSYDYGEAANIVHCSQSTLDLNAYLTIGPIPPDGIWIAPDGMILSDSYLDPQTAVSGIYTFEFLAEGGCIATTYVTVQFQPTINGPIETWVDICSTTEFIIPLDLYEGNPIPGGQLVLFGPNNEFLNFYSTYDVMVNVSDIESGSYFTYIIGASPCEPLFIDLHINIIEVPNTGLNTNTNICNDAEPVFLEDLLNGNPDSNLDWSIIEIAPPVSDVQLVPFYPSQFQPNTTLHLLYSATTELDSCTNSTSLTLTIAGNSPCAAGGFEEAVDTPSEFEPEDMGGFGLVGNPGGFESTWNFILYPNPWQNSERLTLQFRGVHSETTFALRCFDMTGKLVSEQTLIVKEGFNQSYLEFDTNLERGLYLVSLTDYSGRFRQQKLLIE